MITEFTNTLIPTPEAAMSAAPRLRGRVLLAEDGEDNRELICFHLEAAGLTVDVAVDGAEAIRRASAEVYDLVLMDVQMPNVDGLSATRTLRTSGYRRPIVALTAHSTVEEQRQCLDAGCDACLSKPLDLRQFYGVLSKHLVAVVATAA
jgi:CheY-like chemotaxis protein